MSEGIEVQGTHPITKLEDFLKSLHAGYFDNDLVTIEVGIHQRRDYLKEEVRKKVKEVFGEDAEIILAGESSTPRELHNPFIEKRQPPDIAEQLEPQTGEDDIEEEVTSDALSNLNAEQLAALNQGNEPPIESRGAIIGGLASSDIGE